MFGAKTDFDWMGCWNNEHTNIVDVTSVKRCDSSGGRNEMLGSRSSSFPQSLGDKRNISVESVGLETDCAFLFRAHVGRHQELGYFETSVEVFGGIIAVLPGRLDRKSVV